MQYRPFGRTGMNISAVVYGGIVSAGQYDGVNYPELGQQASDGYVSWAIDNGINYFDVAPTYGNAQQQLGNSLKSFRNSVYLACKTAQRSRAAAERELLESLKLLHTDYFDVYQLHAISSIEDVEQAFSSGGVMELMCDMKRKGVIRNIGFSAHSEEAALKMLERFDFDSVLFPVNWFMNLEYGMGSRLLEQARQRGIGVLGMKAFIERKWDSDDERKASKFPKSWCKPIDVDDEAFGIAAMKYALSLGVDTLIPPGNFPSFSFAVERIDECISNPLSDNELALLRSKLENVRGKSFFDV